MSIKLKKPIGLTLQNDTPAQQPKSFFTIGTDQIVSQNQSLVIDQNGLQSAKIRLPYSDLQPVKELGHGSFGVVSLVKDKAGELYALKDIKISNDADTQKNIYRELHSYVDYQHQFIVPTYNVYFVQQNTVSILQKYCKYGSAKDLQQKLKSGHFNENGIGVLAIDTLRALQYVHGKHVTHRDIKPDNILIDEIGNCLLADFGVATSILVSDQKQAQQTFAGSISYMAPERIQSDFYDEKSDIWSLGVSFVELLTGKFPFGDLQNVFDAIQVIVKGDPPLLKKSDGYSGYCCEFVNSMFEKDAKKRKSASELLEMTFCKMYLKKESEVRAQFAKWIRREYGEKEADVEGLK